MRREAPWPLTHEWVYIRRLGAGAPPHSMTFVLYTKSREILKTTSVDTKMSSESLSIHDQDENLLPENVSLYTVAIISKKTCQILTAQKDEQIAAVFRCPHPGCSKSYTRKYRLKEHEKIVHGVIVDESTKNFSCPLDCGVSAFRTKTSFPTARWSTMKS